MGRPDRQKRLMWTSGQSVAKIYIAGSLSMIYIWLANSNDLFWMVWLNLRDTSWNLFESQNEITDSKFLLFSACYLLRLFFVCVCLFVCLHLQSNEDAFVRCNCVLWYGTFLSLALLPFSSNWHNRHEQVQHFKLNETKLRATVSFLFLF